jgi:hypothetical protein
MPRLSWYRHEGLSVVALRASAWSVGLSVGLPTRRLSCDGGRGWWVVEVLGVSAWCFPDREETVGERGTW